MKPADRFFCGREYGEEREKIRAGIILAVAFCFVLAEKISRNRITFKRTYSIVKFSKMLFFTVDCKTGETFWYGNACHNFQVKDKETTLYHLVHPEDEKIAQRHMEQMKSANDSRNDISKEVEIRLQDADGEYRICRCSLAVEKQKAGSPVRLLGYIMDVDELLRSRQVTKGSKSEQKTQDTFGNTENENRVVCDFLEYVSHDLRRPLASVKKMNGNTRQMIENGQYRKAVILTGRIENSLEYLVSLLENIFDMAELKKNGVMLRKQRFDMKRLLKSCDDHFSSLCRQKPISYMWVSSADGQYIGDEKRLRQCVISFLENAVKFNKKDGRVFVDIGKRASLENKCEDIFIIRIRDNGIGMSPEQMESIYRPFVRNKTHESSMEASPGIGLTVSKMILDAMDGSIQICSELQYGTTITLYFSLPRTGKLPEVIDNTNNEMYTIAEK